jgi:hypothetical protein
LSSKFEVSSFPRYKYNFSDKLQNSPQSSSHVPPLLVPQNEQVPPKQAIYIFIDDHTMIDKVVELLHCDLFNQFDVSDNVEWPIELKYPKESEI